MRPLDQPTNDITTLCSTIYMISTATRRQQYENLYSPEMVAIKKNENLTKLTKNT